MLGLGLAQALKGMLSSRTKLVATLHVSNVLGSIVDVKDLAQAVHAVRVCADGTESCASRSAIHLIPVITE